MVATSKTTSSSGKKADGSASNASLSAEVETLRDELSAVMDTLSRITESGASEFANRKEKLKAEGLKISHDMSDRMKANISKFEARTTETVQKHPLQSLGLALGVGFLATLLLRR